MNLPDASVGAVAATFEARQQAVVGELARLRLVPVVAIDDAGHSEDLAAALVRGGLPCLEITLRTEAGLEAIRRASALPGLLVGAGTVLGPAQAELAVEAGAAFVVAPGFNPRTVAWCLSHGVPVFPGVCTPTEVEAAMEFGLEVLKFFPAEAFGGTATLKALCGPYRMVRFLPTGGITVDNLTNYLAIPQVIACGGSWMVAPQWLKSAAWDKVTEVTSAAVELAAAARP